MSRPRKQAYRSIALSDLTRQLLYAPPEKRAEVVRHAEQLHDELDPTKNYPIDFVVYRLTDRRVPPSENVMLVGEAIRPDLRLLIDAISRSTELLCADDDPGMTTAELAQSLGVSAKTVARWRDAGLRWRWGTRDGKQMVLITRSAVEVFQKTKASRVSSASAFSRLTGSEKSRLIARARRLSAATNTSPQSILAHLAKRSGRSIEALRQLMQHHDEHNAAQPVFAGRTGPLTDHQKRIIDRAYRRGVTVSAMCQRFGKARSTIYRTIHEGRARRAVSLTIDAVYSPVFDREDADEVLMQPVTGQTRPRRLGAEVLQAVPETLRPIYDRPIEPDGVVRSLIVRYNFLKHRAVKLQRAIGHAPPRARDLDQFDQLLARIKQARGEVIAAVLPVSLSIVRRQLTGEHRGDLPKLISMLSAAHDVLIEEIDRYDPAVAHTFESVLTNRLLRVLAHPRLPGGDINELELIDQLGAAGFAPA